MPEINNNTVTRWMIYIGVIIVSNLMWNDIVSNFKFPINRHMWCPGFGATYRCDAISKCCKISIVTVVSCWIASLLSTTTEGTILNWISRLESVGCLSQIILWLVLSINMIRWTHQTGALYSGDFEFVVLFCYIIMLLCLFYMAMLISFTEMAYRDAWED